MASEKALKEFIGVLGLTRERLEKLMEHVDNHMGIFPDDVNWGNVGTASYVLEKITEINGFLFDGAEDGEEDNF